MGSYFEILTGKGKETYIEIAGQAIIDHSYLPENSSWGIREISRIEKMGVHRSIAQQVDMHMNFFFFNSNSCYVHSSVDWRLANLQQCLESS